ncbi:MAG: transposase [Candidatus Zixiibacteriota bacterium]
MRRHAYNDPGHAHFLTFSCHRNQQLLTNDTVRHFLVETLDAAREIEQFDLWAYVFMPDHVHLLLHPRRAEHSIPSILRRIKEPSTRRVVTLWRETAPKKLDLLKASFGNREVHRFWQAGGGFDRNLTDMGAVRRAVEYIEYNPVRRGYVKEPGEWTWSSARARQGDKHAPLHVDSLESAFSGTGSDLRIP